MIYFPHDALSRKPHLAGFIEQADKDPTYRAEFESGHVLTRARFTKIRKRWQYQYRFLTLDDVTILNTFQDNVVVGSEPFYWTHLKSGAVFTVRLKNPIKLDYEPTLPDTYKASIEIAEI